MLFLQRLRFVIIPSLALDDTGILHDAEKEETLDTTVLKLQRRFGGDIIKSGNEIIAEKRFKD